MPCLLPFSYFSVTTPCILYHSLDNFRNKSLSILHSRTDKHILRLKSDNFYLEISSILQKFLYKETLLFILDNCLEINLSVLQKTPHKVAFLFILDNCYEIRPFILQCSMCSHELQPLSDNRPDESLWIIHSTGLTNARTLISPQQPSKCLNFWKSATTPQLSGSSYTYNSPDWEK